VRRPLTLLGVASVAAGLCMAAALAGAQTPDVDPRIAAMLTEVSPERLHTTVSRLAAFGTRHTLSSQDDPAAGIGAAAAWIHGEFAAMSPRLQVSYDTYDIPAQGRITRDVRLRNVMAVLPGRHARRIYVSGHYDTVARVPVPSGGFDWTRADNPAPGANDDASGTALTMEVARVLAQSDLEFEATLVFIAFAGEEQGLVGAHLHAQRAEAEGLRIDAVFNNDIIGNARGGNGIVDGATVRVFSEGPEDSPSRHLARFIARQAARYYPAHRVRLIARHDRFGRGGDHTAFNQRGVAGVRFSEARENYARQHTAEDTLDGVDADYLARNTRVNTAAVAVLALAPAAPVVTSARGMPLLDREPSGYDARLRWEPVDGAAAYRVFWRDAWTPDWQAERLVGNVTEVVLPDVSIDDVVFGVAAVGAHGHESVVSVYVNPPRPDVTITVR
jgi:hypothetical protein